MKKKNLVKKTIEKFYKEIVEAESFAGVVNLKVTNSLFNSIGSLSIKKNLDVATLTVNSTKILNNSDNEVEISYHAYQTIAHENEHAKTIFLTRAEKFYSYDHLMALMEYIYYANKYNINFNNISISMFSSYVLRKQLNRNYDLSPSEIIANYISYSRLKQRYCDSFSEEKMTTCNRIIDSLEFLKDNLEVFYDEYGNPLNRFILFITHNASYIKKYPNILEKFQILKNLFHSDGTMKNIYELYCEINAENEEMYSTIITNLLTSVNTDISEFLADLGFKSFIERLVNKYVTSTITYYKNIQKGKLFVNSSRALSDNLIVRKKNVMLLNELKHKYNLDVDCGNIIDSNNIYGDYFGLKRIS